MEESFWVLDPKSLVSSLNMIPTCEMTDDEKLNALTRLTIAVSLVMYLSKYKNTTTFLVASLIIIVILFITKKVAVNRGYIEGFYPDTGRSTQKRRVEPVIPSRSHDVSTWGNNTHSASNTDYVTDISQYHPLEGSVGAEPESMIEPFHVADLCDPNCRCSHGCACKGGLSHRCDHVVPPQHPSFVREDLGPYSVHASTVQPNMYSVDAQPDPINANLGISHATHQRDAYWAEPRHPWFHRNDPQLVRDHWSGPRRSEMPTRDQQSMFMSGFEAQGSVPLDQIYDARDSSYGDPDRAYLDDQLGQIKYYYGNVDAYRAPNFIIRSKVDHADVMTPMGLVQPHYVRSPYVQGQFAVYGTREQAHNKWMDDTTRHREELMERQMRKRNSEMWQLRNSPLQKTSNLRTARGTGSKVQGRSAQ